MLAQPASCSSRCRRSWAMLGLVRGNSVIYYRLAVLVEQLLWLAVRERLTPVFESHGHESQLLSVDCGSVIKAYETTSWIEQRGKNLESGREDLFVWKSRQILLESVEHWYTFGIWW